MSELVIMKARRRLSKNRILMEGYLKTHSFGKLFPKQMWTLPFITTILFIFTSFETADAFVLKNTNSLQKSSNEYRSVSSSSDASSGVCLTQGCMNAATEIKKNLNESVDPCDDFYRFACGGWIENNEILEDQTEVTVFSKLAEEISRKLRVLFEKPLEGSEPEHVVKVKKLYDSCINLDGIESAGSEPLKKALKSLGGWPVVEGKDWEEKNFDWMDTLVKMRELGYNHNILLFMGIVTDPKNNTVHILKMDQADLGTDRSYLLKGLDENSTSAYYKLMLQVAEKLGADNKTAETDMKDVLEFETVLANFSTPQEERRNVTRMYNKYVLKEFQEQIPRINLTKYFNSLIRDPVSEEEILLISEPDYIVKLEGLLNITDKRVIANYLLWRMAFTTLASLSKDWRDLLQEYNAVLSGKTKEKPRWEECVGMVGGSMDIAVSSSYVTNYFENESKDRALEIVGYIQKEFLNILNNVNWMDPKTKEKAKEKAASITSFIGYPNELLNFTSVSELFENLPIPGESHYNNIRIVKKWLFDMAYSKLRRPNVGGGWTTHAITHVINAFYEPKENSIIFPAGILQDPFFQKDRPHYLNFGAIGTIIGHEITHGFDDQGRQYDINGNTINWWEAKTDELFKEKAECIISQYGNYTAENGLQLNGINTQGENIADNGGLKQAYKAYQSWVLDHGLEGTLPELNYTQNQLFWISAAGSWCNRRRPEDLESKITSGVHSPGQFRVIGPMSNLEEFSKDFNCKPDSTMNPRNKCEVW